MHWVARLVCVGALLACEETARSPARHVVVAQGDGVAPGPAPAKALVETQQAPEPVTPGDAAPASSSAAGIPPDAERVAASTPVGHLEGAAHLVHLFEEFEAIEQRRARRDVHVLQFGDSHTASDSGTAVYRRILQARFGDGGRGFVAIGLPWKNYVQDGVHGGMSSEFDSQRVSRGLDASSPGDRSFGLLGVAVGADRRGARAWTELTVPSSRIEIAYLEQPGGGTLDVWIDGWHAGRIATNASQRASGFFGVRVTDAPHRVELQSTSSGAVRVFGMALDRARNGIVVDALGINGAQITTLLRSGEDHFIEQVQHRGADLVVLAYGTNEALEPKLDSADYERALTQMLARVARAAPEASCLLLGPPDLARPEPMAVNRAEERPDAEPSSGSSSSPTGAAGLVHRGGWSSWPPLQTVIDVQRRVAESVGCAFYDQQAAMGGPGSMIAWAAESDPKGQKDRVHFTRGGYTALATSFATDLLQAYDDWRRARRSAPPDVARN